MKLNAFRLTILPLGALLMAATISGAADQKKLQLAFVPNNGASFWTIAKAGTAEAAKEIGEANVTVDFRIPSEPNSAAQQSILNDLVARGEDGIAISPLDPANQTAFLNKIASKTLLICHDSDAPASKRVCYIGTDNTAAGVQAGKLIKEALPNGGKIMIFVGKRDSQNAKERYAGIVQEIAGSKVEIIDVRTDDADSVRAQNNAQDTLVKYPDIAGLVGLYSYNGPAIVRAVRSAGKIGKVKIICFDDEDDTLAAVANGAIYGTVAQQPFEFGKQAIHRMYDYLRGDKSALTPERIIIPTLSLKKDTVVEYQKKMNAILGK